MGCGVEVTSKGRNWETDLSALQTNRLFSHLTAVWYHEEHPEVWTWPKRGWGREQVAEQKLSPLGHEEERSKWTPGFRNSIEGTPSHSSSVEGFANLPSRPREPSLQNTCLWGGRTRSKLYLPIFHLSICLALCSSMSVYLCLCMSI